MIIIRRHKISKQKFGILQELVLFSNLIQSTVSDVCSFLRMFQQSETFMPSTIIQHKIYSIPFCRSINPNIAHTTYHVFINITIYYGISKC